MRVVCLSDTHGLHGRISVPDGDLLVHAGDVSKRGTPAQIKEFAAWFAAQPHRHKVMIAGNHDFAFEALDEARDWIVDAHYLQDEGITLDGVRIWGSPWQPWFHDWAFNLHRGEALREVWAKIPDDTDVLLTHGPPRGILDTTFRGEDVGCDDLLEAVARVRPALHVFGHIHEAYGQLQRGETTFVNASCCTLRHDPSQTPIVIEL